MRPDSDPSRTTFKYQGRPCRIPIFGASTTPSPEGLMRGEAISDAQRTHAAWVGWGPYVCFLGSFPPRVVPNRAWRTSTSKYQQVPTSTGKYQRVSASISKYRRQVPVSTSRYQPVPTNTSQYRPLSYSPHLTTVTTKRGFPLPHHP